MLSRYIEKLDKAKPKRLIKINMFIAAFVCLAHGPVLVLPFVAEIEGFQTAPLFVFFSVPLALSALIYAIFALKNPVREGNVLKYHTILLLLMFGLMCMYSVSILINGIPNEGVRFVWNPVLFAFLFAYPVYLARLVFKKNDINKKTYIKYAHVYAILISISISAFIMGRM